MVKIENWKLCQYKKMSYIIEQREYVLLESYIYVICVSYINEQRNMCY